eukprot:scaffold1541_cov418-Prasinococcus_capsulatus_cf.AAC.13
MMYRTRYSIHLCALPRWEVLLLARALLPSAPAVGSLHAREAPAPIRPPTHATRAPARAGRRGVAWLPLRPGRGPAETPARPSCAPRTGAPAGPHVPRSARLYKLVLAPGVCGRYGLAFEGLEGAECRTGWIDLAKCSAMLTGPSRVFASTGKGPTALSSVGSRTRARRLS